MSFSNRLDLLKNHFHSHNLDGLYVTNLTNIRYLTGFTGSAGSLLILDNKQYFFTDGRYIEQQFYQKLIRFKYTKLIIDYPLAILKEHKAHKAHKSSPSKLLHVR